MSLETIKWTGGKLRIIDQTLLPRALRYMSCKDARDVWRAIKELKVRGAPAIGVAAAFGVILGIKSSAAKGAECLLRDVERACRYLASSRPTAVNLFWALARMERVARENMHKGAVALRRLLLDEALSMLEEDRKACRSMAAFGAKLVKRGDRILTHCNAGALATVDYGTALGVLFKASEEGKKIKVYAGETRPLLQGARLTAWELMKAGIDVTLICDNMAASMMAKGMIDKVFVGADRIASNGDCANKIGTYSLAVLARYHRIPFYVVAPFSTIDALSVNGARIPIEERNPDEVRTILGRRIAPKGVKAYNPAFDVTPAGLISAIVTEDGVFRRPYRFGRTR